MKCPWEIVDIQWMVIATEFLFVKFVCMVSVPSRVFAMAMAIPTIFDNGKTNVIKRCGTTA